MSAPVPNSPKVPRAPITRSVLALSAAVGLAVMFDVLVMINSFVGRYAPYRVDGVPGSTEALVISSLLLELGAFFACVRGNRHAGRLRPFEGAWVAFFSAPGVFAAMLIGWSSLESEGASPAAISFGLAVLLGGGFTALLMYLWGPGPAARSAKDAAQQLADQRQRTVWDERARYEAERAAPARGQVWWAIVAYEEQVGSKKRPVLVLDANDQHVWCLYFTSVDRSRDANFVAAPGSMWDKPKEHSYLRLDRPLQLARRDVLQYECRAPLSLRVQADMWADRHPKAIRRPKATMERGYSHNPAV